jgi:hypothetical protein
MEAWRIIWRDGFAPVLSTKGLLAMRDGLARDDRRIHQLHTTRPACTPAHSDWPCEGACAIGFAAWQGEGKASVGAVDEAFALACWEADDRLGRPAACMEFLAWYDDTPRAVMLKDLLAEVELELAHRLPPPEPRRAFKNDAPVPMYVHF